MDLKAVLNRVIVELHPDYGNDDANAIAAELDGDVLLSYRTFNGYVIEFNDEAHTLRETLDDLNTDDRIAAAYPDILFEAVGCPIDSETLHIMNDRGWQYDQMGFIAAWRMMQGIALDHVYIAVHEHGDLYIGGDSNNPSSVLESELDSSTISLTSTGPVTSNGHKAAVISIIAARNHQLLPARSDGQNFSGIVSSVDGLDYHILVPRGPRIQERQCILGATYTCGHRGR